MKLGISWEKGWDVPLLYSSSLFSTPFHYAYYCKGGLLFLEVDRCLRRECGSSLATLLRETVKVAFARDGDNANEGSSDRRRERSEERERSGLSLVGAVLADRAGSDFGGSVNVSTQSWLASLSSSSSHCPLKCSSAAALLDPLLREKGRLRFSKEDIRKEDILALSRWYSQAP